MIVLGIETSCDETAAAVVERRADGSGRVLSDVVLSQVADHAAFGGVVPEIAARAHVEALDGVVTAALREAGLGFAGIDAVAATAGPGLIGGVIVGLTTAKAIALAAGKPLLAVNHLEGHALTARLTDGLRLSLSPPPRLRRPHPAPRGRRASAAIAGSAAPSTMRSAKPSTRRQSCSGCPIPAGRRSRPRPGAATLVAFALPRPLLGRPGADFSLSGLKTALRLAAEEIAPLSSVDVDDLAASFQAAVVDIVRDRSANAMEMFAASVRPPNRSSPRRRGPRAFRRASSQGTKRLGSPPSRG